LVIPQGVNMDYLRQDFLSMPGLPADLVTQVEQVKDWQHTLIIPIPPHGSSSHVKVGGSEGLLISDQTGKLNAVLWEKGGTLYALGGKIGADNALAAARAIQYP
jgi:hypothetical protein